MTLATLLLIIALALFVLAAFKVASRIDLIAAGLACFIASLLAPLVN